MTHILLATHSQTILFTGYDEPIIQSTLLVLHARTPVCGTHQLPVSLRRLARPLRKPKLSESGGTLCEGLSPLPIGTGGPGKQNGFPKGGLFVETGGRASVRHLFYKRGE